MPIDKTVEEMMRLNNGYLKLPTTTAGKNPRRSESWQWWQNNARRNGPITGRKAVRASRMPTLEGMHINFPPQRGHLKS